VLYLVATPIGNLGDITYRAIDVMRSCTLILCEDTRHARTLMERYEISTPLESYHKFSEVKKLDKILTSLDAGEDIVLISDAGTPGIADPGNILVKECQTRGIETTALPGPCAIIDALVLSGLDATRFQFIGFFPRKDGERRRTILDILSFPGTTITYESPHRLIDVLTLFEEVAPENKLCVARELTKKFEEIKVAHPAELLSHFSQKTVKGEIVLLIEGSNQKEQDWEKLSAKEHVTLIETTFGIKGKEAIKIVAEIRGVPKREIYAKNLETDDTTL